MWYSLLADLVVLLHFIFVLFVLFGGLLAVKWPSVVWLHGPALAWGAIVELTGSICPLTPLESRLRILGGESGYQSDFLVHWLLPVLYPDSLTRGIQIALGTFVLILNAAIYGWVRWNGPKNRPN